MRQFRRLYGYIVSLMICGVITLAFILLYIYVYRKLNYDVICSVYFRLFYYFFLFFFIFFANLLLFFFFFFRGGHWTACNT
jgi:hypothetical protein